MSELKDLAWAAQDAIDPLPFEQLERRGVRRRRRRQALVAAGAATVVVLAAVVPWGTRSDTQPPIAPSVPPLVNASDPAGEALVRGADAEVTSVTLASSKRWGATGPAATAGVPTRLCCNGTTRRRRHRWGRRTG